MFEVIYEDLAARPTETADGVLRFLGLLPANLGESGGGGGGGGAKGDAAGGRCGGSSKTSGQLQPLKETTKQSTTPLKDGVENWDEVVRATRVVSWM